MKNKTERDYGETHPGEREAFEAWAIVQDINLTRGMLRERDYSYMEADYAWRVWRGVWSALSARSVFVATEASVAGICQRCGGSGFVPDGEITGSGGVEFENGPVQCVKDCPECTAPRPSPVDGLSVLYDRLMYGAVDIGEAYLKLKVVGSCPSEQEFVDAVRALLSEAETK